MQLSSNSASRRKTRLDNWTNAVTGLGTTRDKAYYSEYTTGQRLSSLQLENLYHYNDIVSVICETYPEACFRKGINVAGDNKDAVLAKLQELDVVHKFIDAAVWANVFGGSVIYIGTNESEDLSAPLNPRAVQDIKYLNVFDSRELIPRTYYTDFNSTNCGLPETFLVVNSIQPDRMLKIIHESRLIIFDGLRVTNFKRQELNGWGQSLIQRAYDTIKSFGVGFETLSHLIHDANQAVFGMKDYVASIEKGDVAVIKARLEGMDMSRSAVRALVTDSEDTFKRESFNWSGIDKPFILLMERLGAAVQIPVTILMGRSPAGQNATGESDFRGFYDRAQSKQSFNYLPKLQSLVNLIDKTKSTSVSFPPIWEPTYKETADLRKTVADTDAIYLDRGILTAEEIQLSRFTDQGWRLETVIDTEMRDRLHDAELKAIDVQGTITNEGVGSEPVEKQALNGIQISNLKLLLQEYALPENKLTRNQVIGIIEIAFPSITAEQIAKLVP